MNNLIQKTVSFLKSFFNDPLFLRRWDDPVYYSFSKNNNQLSIRVSGGKRRDLYSYNGDGFIFIRDMYSGIMPFMHYKGKRELYPVKLEPASSFEKKQLIAEGISQRGRAYFLEDALCDFVRTTTQVLFSDGVVFYEIIYEKNKDGEVESFELEFIRSRYFFHFLSSYYQFIPWSEAKKSHVKVQIIKIPKEKILKISFPKKLGGEKKLRRVIKRLWQLSKELVPKFQMEAMENNKSIGFDGEEFSKTKYLEIAKLTKNFGWSQGQRLENNITEYYLIARHLRAKKAEASVREEIISKLNEALNGPILNLGVKVSMENLFTVKDVEKQESILRKGNVAFIDVINSIKN